MKKLILFSILIAGALQLTAQQDPHYSQYMFNGMVLNPAYAGSRDHFSASLLYRKQWAGFEGAPVTQSFGIHAPSRNMKSGFGLSLYNDKIGATNVMNLAIAYAYRLDVGEKGKLAFGLQGSVQNYKLDYTKIRVEDAGDAAFTGNNVNLILPNAGAGIYFNTDNMYAGVSVPNLIPNNIHPSGTALDSKQAMHMLGTAGVVIGLSKNIKFKPSTMIKYVPGAPVSVDLNGSFLFAEKFWIGGSYRVGDAAVVMVEWWVTKQLRLGYAYDMTTSDLKTANSGSHEIMLGFDFSFDKKRIISPRYF